MEAPTPPVIGSGVYRNRPAQGIARVVCYSPRHDLSLAQLKICEIEELITAWQREYVDLGGRPDIDHVLIFENKGEVVGVSSVDPMVEYPVLAATRHPIYEHPRVNSFAAILKNWKGDEQARKLGELMYESHVSYSECGLGSDGTDALVAFVRASAEDGLYGAKITGGGSGGTVAVLGRRGAGETVCKVAACYREQTGYEPAIISGSSPGSNAFGYLKIG